MDKNKEIIKNEVGEDATKYGEFVSSYFAWISLPNQKEVLNFSYLEMVRMNKFEKI